MFELLHNLAFAHPVEAFAVAVIVLAMVAKLAADWI